MILNVFSNIIKIISQYYPLLFQGLGVTLLLSLITVVFGAVIGFIICFMGLSKSKILSTFSKIYVEVIRGVPLLLQLLIIYLIFPNNVDTFISAAIALVINSGAYVSEIIRAGIQAVDKGQYEASRSLGISHFKTMQKIIIPQAIKNILPAIGNEYVTVIKETSLASTFFIGDLMTAQKVIGSKTYLYLDAYIVVACFYFISTFTLSKIIRYFERRMKTSD